MRAAEWINIVYFAALGVLSLMLALPPARRVRVLGVGAMGLALALGAGQATSLLGPGWGPIARDLLPAPMLILAYWQAGYLYTAPWLALERRLERIDEAAARALRSLSGVARSSPVTAYLEGAYLFAYPFVPLALAALYAAGLRLQADYFWSVVLPPSYFCYAMLPFAPTRPPRMRSRGLDHEPATPRTINIWVLDRMGIGANTFPSGHVAATTASALVLVELAPAAGAVFLAVAGSIAVSVVLRRYHYLADAILGALLALATWLLLSR